MSDYFTEQELRELAQRLRESTQKANELFEVLKNVLEGDDNETFYIDGKAIPSLNKRVKDTIGNAIASGDIEIPSGKVIDSISIVDDELVINYKDV